SGDLSGGDGESDMDFEVEDDGVTEVFDVAFDIVHRYVGDSCKHLKHIEDRTRANVYLLPVVSFKGSQAQVAAAVGIMKHTSKRFNFMHTKRLKRQQRYTDPAARKKRNRWTEQEQLTKTQQSEVDRAWADGDINDMFNAPLNIRRGSLQSLKNESYVSLGNLKRYLVAEYNVEPRPPITTGRWIYEVP
ncbi:hypothetical protein HK097_004958, partial [Rhizophlyctis rosea]